MKILWLALGLSGVLLTGCQALSSNATSNPVKSDKTTQIATSVEQRNKANALAFYDLAFNQHQLQKAVDLYVAEPYLQHNPDVADGGKAFIDAFAPFIAQYPHTKATVKRVIAQDDLVMLHVHSQLNDQDRGQAVVDIFRFDKNGKIVEHWDVIQNIPEKTASGRSMF